MENAAHPLTLDPVRARIEEAVSAHLRRPWRAQHFTDLKDLSSHPSALLADGSYTVFAKLSRAANALDQLEVELDGLRALTGLAGALTPAPIGLLQLEDGAVMLLEGLREIERGPREWRQIGHTLARIHQAQGERFGYAKNGYFGPLFQDNRPASDWLTFFSERRLWPRLAGAIDSGHLPTPVIRMAERLIARLPALDIPPTRPCLLHGDAQKNNYISAPAGAVVIDPAIFYGHPEYDLAYIDYFAPVPALLFDAYREILPIAPGFVERRDLWRIPAHLGVLQLTGAAWLDKLTAALRKYL